MLMSNSISSKNRFSAMPNEDIQYSIVVYNNKENRTNNKTKQSKKINCLKEEY